MERVPTERVCWTDQTCIAHRSHSMVTTTLANFGHCLSRHVAPASGGESTHMISYSAWATCSVSCFEAHDCLDGVVHQSSLFRALRALGRSLVCWWCVVLSLRLSLVFSSKRPLKERKEAKCPQNRRATAAFKSAPQRRDQGAVHFAAHGRDEPGVGECLPLGLVV